MTEEATLTYFPITDNLHNGMNDSNHLYGDIRKSFATYGLTETIVFICIYVVVFIVGLVGNLLVLFVVLMNKKMRNTTNYFLVNLAVADLLVTLVCIPLTVAQKMYTIWLYGEFLCKISDYLQGISICASVLTIVVMCLERFIAICYPMQSRKFCTTVVIYRGIVMVWMVSGIIMIPMITVKRFDVVLFNADENLTFCREAWPSPEARQAYDIFLVCFIYILPGSMVVTLYVRVGKGLWTTSTMLRRADSSLNNSRNVINSRRRIAGMMIIISILFAVCWLPYYILTLYLDFNIDNPILDWFSYALLLGHSNSAQNPLLYCCMHRGFKNAVKRMCRKSTREINSRISTQIHGRDKHADRDYGAEMTPLCNASCPNSEKHHPTNMYADVNGTSRLNFSTAI